MVDMCDYDEAYSRDDAYEIGWCYKCRANLKCPYIKKAIKENKKYFRSQIISSYQKKKLANFL